MTLEGNDVRIAQLDVGVFDVHLDTATGGVRIGKVTATDERVWVWQHRDGERSSPLAASLVAATQALVQYHCRFKADSAAATAPPRGVNVALTDRRMLADRLCGAARTHDTPDTTTAEEVARLGADLVQGKRIEAGAWLREFIPEFCAGPADHVSERVVVDTNGCVWLTVTRL